MLTYEERAYLLSCEIKTLSIMWINSENKNDKCNWIDKFCWKLAGNRKFCMHRWKIYNHLQHKAIVTCIICACIKTRLNQAANNIRYTPVKSETIQSKFKYIFFVKMKLPMNKTWNHLIIAKKDLEIIIADDCNEV